MNLLKHPLVRIGLAAAITTVVAPKVWNLLNLTIVEMDDTAVADAARNTMELAGVTGATLGVFYVLLSMAAGTTSAGAPGVPVT